MFEKFSKLFSIGVGKKFQYSKIAYIFVLLMLLHSGASMPYTDPRQRYNYGGKHSNAGDGRDKAKYEYAVENNHQTAHDDPYVDKCKCNGLSRNFIEIEEIFAKRNKNAPSTIKMIRLCKELLGKGGSGMVFKANLIELVPQRWTKHLGCYAAKTTIDEKVVRAAGGKEPANFVVKGTSALNTMIVEMQVFEMLEHERHKYPNAFQFQSHIIELGVQGRDKASKEPKDVWIVEELGIMDLSRYFKEYQREIVKKEIFLDDIIEKFWDMAESLMQLHRVCIHMDVKPLNFVIANKGRNMAAGRSRRTMVKIIDFGYVQFANSKRTRKGFIRTTQFRGTLEYTSPEMFRPAFFNRKKEAVYEVSEACDIWGIGMILYQMLFGFNSLPFDHQLLAEARSLSGEDAKRFYAVEVYQALRNFRILFNEKRTIFITIQSQRDQERIVLIIEIIAACLQMDPTARPSPKGILDFLSRKCRFETTYRDRFLPEKKVLEKIFNFLLPMKDEKN